MWGGSFPAQDSYTLVLIVSEVLYSVYSRPSLIRTAWDQHLFRLVEVSD